MADVGDYFRHGDRIRHESTGTRRRREKWISSDVNSALDHIRDGSERCSSRLRARNRNIHGNSSKEEDSFTQQRVRLARDENGERHLSPERISQRYRRYHRNDPHYSLRVHDYYSDSSERDHNIRRRYSRTRDDVEHFSLQAGRDSGLKISSGKSRVASSQVERRSNHARIRDKNEDSERRHHHNLKKEKKKKKRKKKSKEKDGEKYDNRTTRYGDGYYQEESNYDDEREGGYRSGASVTSRFLNKSLEKIRNLATSSNGEGKVGKSSSDRQLGMGDLVEDSSSGGKGRPRRQPSVSMHGTPWTDANFLRREEEKKNHKDSENKGLNHALNRSLTRLSDALALNLTRHDRVKHADIQHILKQHEQQEAETERKQRGGRGRRMLQDEARASAVTVETSNYSIGASGTTAEPLDSTGQEYFERPRSPLRAAAEQRRYNKPWEHKHVGESRERSEEVNGHTEDRYNNTKISRRGDVSSKAQDSRRDEHHKPHHHDERHIPRRHDEHHKSRRHDEHHKPHRHDEHHKSHRHHEHQSHRHDEHHEHPENMSKSRDLEQQQMQILHHGSIQSYDIDTSMDRRRRRDSYDSRASDASTDEIKLSTLMYQREWDAVHFMLFDEGTDIDGYHQSKDKAMDIVELSCFEGEQGSNLLHVICRHQPPLHIVFDICHEWPWMALQPDYCGRRFPLHLACLYGCQSSVVLYLLDLYVDAAMKRDSMGCVPLHYACRPIRWTAECSRSGTADRKNQEEMEPAQLIRPGMAVVEALCDVEPQAVHVPDNNGKTPLHWAIQEGLTKGICKILVSAAEITLSEDHSPHEPLNNSGDTEESHYEIDHHRPRGSEGDDSSVGTGTCTHISIGGSRHGRRDPKLHLFLSKNSLNNGERGTSTEQRHHSRQRVGRTINRPKEDVVIRHNTSNRSSASYASASERSQKSTRSYTSLRSSLSRNSRRIHEGDHISVEPSMSGRNGKGREKMHLASSKANSRSSRQRGNSCPRGVAEFHDDDDDSVDLNYLLCGNERALPFEDSMSSLETATQRWNENYGEYRSDDEGHSSTGARGKAPKKVGGHKKQLRKDNSHDWEFNNSGSDSREIEDRHHLMKDNAERPNTKAESASSVKNRGGSSQCSSHSSGLDEELLYQNSEKQEDPPRKVTSDSQHTVNSLDSSSNADRNSHSETTSQSSGGEQLDEHLKSGELTENEGDDVNDDLVSAQSAESYSERSETEATSNDERGNQRSPVRENVLAAEQGRIHRKLVQRSDNTHSKGTTKACSSPESQRSSMAVYRGKKGKSERHTHYAMEAAALNEANSEEGCSSSESVASSIAVAAAHVVAAFPNIRRGEGECGSSALDLEDPELTRRIAELFATQGHEGSSKSTSSARYRLETAGGKVDGEALELLRKQRSLPSLNGENKKPVTENDTWPRRSRKEETRIIALEEKCEEIEEEFEFGIRSPHSSKKHYKSSLSSSWSRVSDDQIRNLLKKSRKRNSPNSLDHKVFATGQSLSSNEHENPYQPPGSSPSNSFSNRYTMRGPNDEFTKISPPRHIREEQLRELLKNRRERKKDCVNDHYHSPGKARGNIQRTDDTNERSVHSRSTEPRDNSTAAILRKHQRLQQAISAADKKRNGEKHVVSSHLPTLRRRDTSSSENTTETESSAVHEKSSRENYKKSSDDNENAPSSTGETSAGG